MLVRLPAQPKIGTEVIARAVMARRRGELIDAAKPNPNDPAPDLGGLVEVICPPGWSACVQSKTIRNRFYYPETNGEHTTIKLPWHEFIALTRVTECSGPNGGCWLEANPHLAALFPKNAPPVPAPLQD